VRASRFRDRFAKGSSVLIDTAPLIYHLEDIEPWSELTTIAFELIGAGDLQGFLSSVSVAELMIKPFEKGAATATAAEQFLLSMPNVTIAPVDYSVAVRAAELRARLRLRMPDALIGATGITLGVDRILTNDARLEACETGAMSVVLLSRFVA
jgi:predicted nucleic acid-binding protein